MKIGIISFILFSFCNLANGTSIKNLDVEIIAPSSGYSEEIWNKVFGLTGKKCIIFTKSTDDQVFVDPNFKFNGLDKSLRSKRKILWTFRGGYGVDKIMKQISFSDYSSVTKKILIGYSDITNLLVHFSQKYGWTAIHGMTLKDIVIGEKSNESYSTLVNLLHKKIKHLKISDLIPLNDKARIQNNVKGKVSGGNLTCLGVGIGTTWQINSKNKILFLEDVHVKGYYLDRILTHLHNAGIFDSVVAIIFGDCGEGTFDVLKAFADKLKIPVYKSESFGHGKNNIPFVYDAIGTISKNGDHFKVVMKINKIC